MRLIGSVQHVPCPRFVGMDDRTGRNPRTDRGDCGALPIHDNWNRSAIALADNDDALPLRGLFKPPIFTICLAIFLFGVSAKEAAINFYNARKLCLGLNRGPNRLADLVSQYVSGFVLY